jgi:membrane protease YdiL (CAAX protease family)
LNHHLRNYHGKSRGILYSYIICVPLLLLYEILIRISQPQSDAIIRISVDAWFKTIFQQFGTNTISATFLIAAIIGGVIIYKRRNELSSLKKNYFGYMLLESLFYALLIGTVIGFFLDSILNMQAESPLHQLTKLQLIALSLGAGLYEELFFRVILVSFLLFLFKQMFNSHNTAYIVAAVLAALIFSAVHYVGEFGDFFTVNSFLFRFFFGLALNVLYVTRGFGIAAWTHAIYDLLVISFM